MSKPTDVIIAGAGPVGLFLACELALTGVSVLVLERDAAPNTPWKEDFFGRRGLFLRATEAFYRRGMLDVTIEGGIQRPTHLDKGPGFVFGGHFAGMMLNANKIDFSRWKYHLPGPAFLPARSSLGRIESALSERAQTLGVQIIRGMRVTKVSDEGDTVKVWAGDECFEAQWLIGCDGGRSTVRKAAGFKFEGTGSEFMGYIASCDLENQELLKPGFNRTESGLYIDTGPGKIYAVDFDLSFDRSQPVTREHFQTVLQRVSGLDITVKALHLNTTFTARSKQATEYRRGRVFLAGDSAHIHSPLGAQGLTAGMGDAINLGWKLAATIKGYASPGLLDTYHQERHPVGADVLEWTRAQVATLRPDPYGRAAAKIMQDLINTDEGATYFADRIWGISQRYDLGDTHPLVGCSAPDFEFEDGMRLGPKLEKGRFLIIDFLSNSSVAQLAQGLEPFVDYFASNAKEKFGLKTLLVRPDGAVAWATEDEVDIGALMTALSRWLSLPGLEGRG